MAIRAAAAALGFAGSAAYGGLYIWAAPDASGWSGGWPEVSLLVVLGALWATAAAGALMALKRPALAVPLLAIPGVVGFVYYLWPAGLAMLSAAGLSLWAAVARSRRSGRQL